MEGLGPVDPSEVLLACAYSPGFITNINKDVISTVESTERQSRSHSGTLDRVLHNENCFLQLLTINWCAPVRKHPDRAIFAEDGDWHTEVRRTGTQRGLRDI